MSLALRVNVDGVDDRIAQYGAGAKLYWARDNSSPTGSFADASGSVTLVAGQSAYEITDATGQDGHYYRTRLGNSGGTDFSGWSDVFRGGAIAAYATVYALREYIGLSDDSRDNLLADLLRRASAWIDADTDGDFYRHPQVTGTEQRTYDLTGHDGRIRDVFAAMPTLVEYTTYTGGTYTALAATDWVLDDPRTVSGPWLTLRLSDQGALRYFWPGYAMVRITGIFGYLTVPADIELATLDLAREMYHIGVGGRTVGLDYGRMPAPVQAVIERYRPVLVG